MDDTFDESGEGEPSLEVIRTALLEMPVSERGNSVDRLIQLVEVATALARIDVNKNAQTDILNKNNPAFVAAKIEFEKLVKQAQKLLGVMSSPPWNKLEAVEGLSFVILRNKAADVDVNIGALAQEIEMLANFPLALGRGRGRPHHSQALKYATRAVCFYRQEEGLALQYHFDAVEPLGDKSRISTDQELQPTNDTAALACKVAGLWGLGTHVEVRTALRNYHAFLKAQGRTPIIEDLALTF